MLVEVQQRLVSIFQEAAYHKIKQHFVLLFLKLKEGNYYVKN